MGIHQLAPIIQILFPNAITTFGPAHRESQYDVFALDLNGILYSLFSRNQSDDDLILAVIKYIDNIVQSTPPNHTLLLALDGSVQYNVRKLSFTPGTKFMADLKNALCLYAARFLTQSKYVKVIVSGSDREGEGEYKIFEYLKYWRQHEPKLGLEKERLKCLILGVSDTDMILFSLLSANDLDIDLLRVDGPEKTITSVNKVREALLNGLQGESERLVLDWCFLTVFCGTDFAPRLGGFDYRKVHAVWRNFKSEASNEHRYMVHPLVSGEFELQINNFEEILKGSNFVDLHYTRLQISTERKNRAINLSNSDWKCNWNTLKQAFCKDLSFDVQTKKISTMSGGQSYITQISWISPTSGERILAGEGEGINARTSEYFASLAVCMPSSSIMVTHIQPQISTTDFEILSSAISHAASSGSATMISDLNPRLKSPSTHSTPEDGAEKRVYALTRDAKTINHCPEACEQLLKSVFWTLHLLRAEIVYNAHFYPFNLVPSVDAMQNYLKILSTTQKTIQWTQISPQTLKSLPNSNCVSVPSYNLDSLPPLQYLLMLSKVAPTLLHTISHDAYTLLHGSDSAPAKFHVETLPLQINAKHILEKTTVEVTREAFELELADRSNKFSVPIDPLLLSNNPSLLFLNSVLSVSSLEGRKCATLFEQRNSEILKEAVPCDLAGIAQVVSARIKTWTGSKFRKISVFAESPVINSHSSLAKVRRFNVPISRPYCVRVLSSPSQAKKLMASTISSACARLVKQR